MRVLVVEEERPTLPSLARHLEEEHFAVDVANNSAEADAKARLVPYDVIILDLMVPRIDGLALLQRWRGDGLKNQVLVLTGDDSPRGRGLGLDAGADDCLTRPFELEELVARLRALIRRRYQVKGPIIRAHDLEIDTPARTVRRAGQLVALTPREYSLLELLAFQRGRVLTRAEIAEHLYGEQNQGGSNVVDVYIRYLRNKIDRGFEPALILTRWGEGYMLRGDD